MNRTVIENQMWSVRSYLLKKLNSNFEADIMVSPLVWFIVTGRASTPFIHWFLDTKPYVIGRVLLNTPGSTDDVVRALKAKAGIAE